jgi:hypothetical protein
MAINRGSIGQQIMKPGKKRLTKTSGKKSGKRKSLTFKRKNRLY